MSPCIGPVMLDLEGTSLTRDEQRLLCCPQVGGVIVFGRNIDSPRQLRTLCDQIRRLNPDILIGIDQEGGRVQRVRSGVTPLPAMGTLGQRALESPKEGIRLVRDTGWLLGMEMAACGLDFSFAPVLDVDTGVSAVIGDRSFGDCPAQVAVLGEALVAGLHEAGMAAVGKHFPGHGSVAEDSHHAMAVDTRSMEAIKAHDLVPFAKLAASLDGMMPAHVIYPAFDSRPAGFSPSWLGMLRESLGFKGCVFSDDLSMAAASIEGGVVARARAAIEAGCDMVLVCNHRRGVMDVIDACAGMRVRVPSSLRYARARPELESLNALGRFRRTRAALASLTRADA